MHFTRTSSSWTNLAEGFSADLTQDCGREGSFSSVRELTVAITTYLAERNEAAKPYWWKTSGKNRTPIVSGRLGAPLPWATRPVRSASLG